ncbi:C-type lectin 37Da, partial [Gryllus bimaculatus]
MPHERRRSVQPGPPPYSSHLLPRAPSRSKEGRGDGRRDKGEEEEGTSHMLGMSSESKAPDEMHEFIRHYSSGRKAPCQKLLRFGFLASWVAYLWHLRLDSRKDHNTRPSGQRESLMETSRELHEGHAREACGEAQKEGDKSRSYGPAKAQTAVVTMAAKDVRLPSTEHAAAAVAAAAAAAVGPAEHPASSPLLPPPEGSKGSGAAGAPSQRLQPANRQRTLRLRLAAMAAATLSPRSFLAPAPASAPALLAVLLLSAAAFVSGQRITTIQLDGTQYFVSRMNPYSPELNYFLAYQYCRSLGLQLASFESREKADSLMQYLRNAGYNKFDYWTSGNRLGTDMLLWMSTGSPFNTTFDYMRRLPTDAVEDEAEGGAPLPGNAVPAPLPASAPAAGIPATRAGLGRARSRRPGRQSTEEVAVGCIALKSPSLDWDTDDCLQLKDFICEQTRCYYYNYGSIPVSTSQGDKRTRPTYAPPHTSTSTQPPLYVGASAADSDSNATASQPQPEETVNRRITMRPPAPSAPGQPDPAPSATDSPTAAEGEEPQDDSINFASRSFPEKDAVANVVYVTAVGADALNASGQYVAAESAGAATTGATATAAEGAVAPTTAAVDEAPPAAEEATPALLAAAAAPAPERPVTFSRGRVDPINFDTAYPDY